LQDDHLNPKEIEEMIEGWNLAGELDATKEEYENYESANQLNDPASIQLRRERLLKLLEKIIDLQLRVGITPTPDQLEKLRNHKQIMGTEIIAESGPAPNVNTEPTPRKRGTNRKKWDDKELKALYLENNLPGVTHQFLAKKHGVTRQRISTLLKLAKAKLMTPAILSPYLVYQQPQKAKKIKNS